MVIKIYKGIGTAQLTVRTTASFNGKRIQITRENNSISVIEFDSQ